jgi:hypothetical protein
MKLLLLTLTLTLYASALHTTGQMFGVFRPGMDNTNVEVARLLPQDEVEILPNRKEMRVKARPGTAFEIVFKCNEEGKSLIFTEGAGYKWVGCCPAGTKLMGNDTTAFDCCDGGEDVTGCKATNGYECCPSGYTWDGNDCTIIDDNHPCRPPPDCPMGQVRSIIDGMCIMACEPDMILNSEGFCVCPDGQVFDGVECLCALGTEKSDDGTCQTKCPDGSTRMANGECRPIECGPGEILINGDCVAPCKPPAVLTRGTCKVPRCPKGSIRSDDICTSPCPPGQIFQDEIRTCIRFGKRCPKGLVRFSNDDECTSLCQDEEMLVDDECICQAGKQRSPISMLCEDIVPDPPTTDPVTCLSGITTGKSNAKFQSRYNTNFRSRQMLHPHLRKWTELWLPRSLRLLHGLFRPPIQQIPSLPQRNLLSRPRTRSRGLLQPARDLRRTSTHIKREEKNLRQQRQ